MSCTSNKPLCRLGLALLALALGPQAGAGAEKVSAAAPLHQQIRGGEPAALQQLFQREFVANGRITYSWVTRAALQAHYEVMPLNKMYAMLFLSAPRYSAALMGGVAGLGQEVGKDVIFETAKMLLEHPETAAREIGVQVFAGGVKAYDANYKLYHDYVVKRTDNPEYVPDQATLATIAKNTMAVELLGAAKTLIVAINQAEHSSELGTKSMSTQERRLAADAADQSADALATITNLDRELTTVDYALRTAEVLNGVRLPLNDYPPFAAFRKRVAEIVAGYGTKFDEAPDWLGELLPENVVAMLWVGESAVAGPAAPMAAQRPAAAAGAPFDASVGLKMVWVAPAGVYMSATPVTFGMWREYTRSAGVNWKSADLFRYYDLWDRRHGDPVNVPYRVVTEPLGDAYPAVGVGPAAINDFARWLTERDRQAGRIGARDRYRLPLVTEWKAAADYKGSETWSAENDFEAFKVWEVKRINGRQISISDRWENLRAFYADKSLFPWGRGFPPPENYGNFRGAEGMNSHLNPDNDIPYIPFLRDAFRYTAPVGSFPPNAYGLYDMWGNVRQWTIRRGLQKNGTWKTTYCQLGASWMAIWPYAFEVSGGNWNSEQYSGQADEKAWRYRSTLDSDTGFRLVLEKDSGT